MQGVPFRLTTFEFRRTGGGIAVDADLRLQRGNQRRRIEEELHQRVEQTPEKPHHGAAFVNRVVAD